MQQHKLFIGGLPYETSEEEFRSAFADFGSITSVLIVKDKMTGRSKGFGFVEYSTDEEAQRAIEMMNGKVFNGRPLSVSVARPLESRPPRTGGNDRGPRSWN